MDGSSKLTRRALLQGASAAGFVALASGSSGRSADRGKTDRHLPEAKPEDIGIDPRRLQVSYDLLETWTRGRDPLVPGGAILVGRNGKVVAPRFFGRQGPERDAPAIRKDAMFLMASITKPVVYLGALMLVERGLLSLSDKVTRHVPEFAAHGKGATLVGHLFTHTSGLPDTTS